MILKLGANSGYSRVHVVAIFLAFPLYDPFLGLHLVDQQDIEQVLDIVGGIPTCTDLIVPIMEPLNTPLQLHVRKKEKTRQG